MPTANPLQGISDVARYNDWVNTQRAYGFPQATGYTGGVYSPPSSGAAASGSATSAIDNAIPGFSGLSQQASSLISQLMSGKLPEGVNQQIQQGRAQQSVASGMPGSSRMSGSLQGNATLRDLGLTSLQTGQQGFENLLNMLGTYSGNVFPTANANLSASVERERIGAEQNMLNQRLTQQEKEFARSLGLSEQQLQSENAYRFGQLGIQQGQLGVQQGQLGLDAQRIQNQADQFAQNLSQEDRRLAQQLGLTQQQYALELARLNSDRELAQQRQSFTESQALWNLLGSGNVNTGNIDQFLNLLGLGGTTSNIPKRYQVPQVNYLNP